MSKIKGTKTSIEMYIRSRLYADGLRYRANYKQVDGKPDLYFTKQRTAVFIHGCFWHRHYNCKIAYTPKSNIEFWTNKFQSNITRDKEVTRLLREKEIRQLVVWECTVKRMQKDSAYEKEILAQIEDFIRSGQGDYCEL